MARQKAKLCSIVRVWPVKTGKMEKVCGAGFSPCIRQDEMLGWSHAETVVQSMARFSRCKVAAYGLQIKDRDLGTLESLPLEFCRTMRMARSQPSHSSLRLGKPTARAGMPMAKGTSQVDLQISKTKVNNSLKYWVTNREVRTLCI